MPLTMIFQHECDKCGKKETDALDSGIYWIEYTFEPPPGWAMNYSLLDKQVPELGLFAVLCNQCSKEALDGPNNHAVDPDRMDPAKK